MRNLLAIAALTLTLPFAASAADFQLGEGKPLASITVPDNWSPEEFENGVQGESADGVYFFAKVVEASDGAKAVEDSLKFLEEQGVTITEATSAPKDGETRTVNGLEFGVFDWKGKDKEGDTAIQLVAYNMVKENGHFVILTTWAPPEVKPNELESYVAILNSVKQVK